MAPGSAWRSRSRTEPIARRTGLVVDEWPDEKSFQAFYEASPDIKTIMDNAGVTAAPTIEFWRPLDVDDAID